MSTHIENEVVSMQFDNKHFESNVRTSLSTLEKLKQSLKLHDAAKGFEDISKAAKKVDLSSIGDSAMAVVPKFSAMYATATHYFDKILSSADRLAKNLIHTFAIDPVKTGFSEYELKMGSIQTIMASTGEDLATVNRYLDELNTYSDKTIYSFSDMTTNIGKFTNAGVKLEDAVKAIQGISNVAAVSGANANEASRAMYNFAQALSAGYVKLMDWKSIELANMATVEFKNQLLDAAVAAGTLTKTSDGMYKTMKGTVISATKNFNESLNDQWMTTEVLISTLGDYADETTKIGEKAFAAAQDVKTFSQMMDTLKESAQSGWAQTWELIFGDFEEGKTLWTSINEVLSGIIESSAKSRNSLLSGALDSGWEKMTKTVSDAGIEVSAFEEEVKRLAETSGIDIDGMIKEYGSLEKAILKCENPINILEQAFNNLFGGGPDKDKDGLKEYTVKEGDTLSELAEKWGTSVEEIMLLNKFITDPDMILTGWVLEIPRAIDESGEAAEGAAKHLENFRKTLAGVEEAGGRTKLIESFSNLWKVIKKITTPIGEAFREVFKPITSEQLLGAITTFHTFTEKLANSKSWEGVGKNLKDTFQGVFSLIDIIGKIIGGGLKLGWQAFSSILSHFNLNITDFTAGIGRAITKLNEWLEAGIDKGIEWLIDAVTWLYNLPIVQNFIKSFTESWTKFKEAVSARWDKGVNAFFEWLDRIKQLDGFDLKNIKTALVDFKDNVLKSFFGVAEGESIFDKISESFKKFWAIVKEKSGKIWDSIKTWFDGFKELDGFSFENIKKAFTSFYTDVIKPIFTRADGTTIFDSVISTLKTFWDLAVGWFSDRGVDLTAIKDRIIGFVSGIVEYFKENKGSITAFTMLITIFLILKKAVDLGKLLVNSISFLGDISGSLDKFVKDLGNSLKATTFKTVAEGIAILAGAIAVFAFIPLDKLWPAIGAIAVISGILLGVYALSSLIANKLGTADLIKFAGSMLAVSGALMIFALAASVIGAVGDDALRKTAGILIGFVGIVGALALLSRLGGANGSKIFQSGSMLLGLGAFLVLLSIAIKKFGEMDPNVLTRGLTAVTVLLVEAVLVMAATNTLAKVGKKQSIIKTGSLFASLGTALLMMAGAVAILGNMSTEALIKGLISVTLIIFLLAGVMAATNKLPRYNKDVTGIINIGSMFAGIGAALLMTAGAVAIFGHMDTNTLLKGGAAVIVFLGMMIGVMAATKLLATTGGDQQFAKVGGTIMAMSAGLILIAAAVALLSMIDKEDLINAGVAIAGIMALFSMMLVATHGIPPKAMGTIIALSVAVIALAGSLVMLSSLGAGEIKEAGLALASVMLIFSYMLKSSKKIGIGSAATILLLAGVIAGLAWLVTSVLDIESAKAQNALQALSGFMLALSISVKVLSSAVKHVPATWGGLLRMGAALLIIGGIAVGLGAAAIAALPWLGDQLRLFAENARPFFLALGTLAISGAGGSLKAIGDIMAGVAELTSSMAKMALLDALPGVDILSKGEDGLSNLDRMVEWYKSVFKIAKDIAIELSAEGLTLNHLNIKSVMTVVSTLAELAGSVPATITAAGGAGWGSKWLSGGLGGAVKVVPMLTEAKNWIVEVLPIVKSVALELSGEGVTINQTNLDAVVGAASSLATAAASAPSTTIAGGAFVSKWLSGGGGVIDVPMIAAAGGWIEDVTPVVRRLAESVTSGKAKDLDKDALDAVCTGATTLAEAAALAPSVEIYGGLVSGPWGWGLGGTLSIPLIEKVADWICAVEEPIVNLATSVKTLGYAEIDRENLTTIVTSIATLGSINFPTFTAGGGLAGFAGGIGAAFGWNTPAITAVTEFITKVKNPIIKLANAVSGVAGKDGVKLEGEINKEAFESILGAIKQIAEIKFPSITVGGGLAGFSKGVALAFGYNSPQLNAVASFITSVKDPIIGLANAVSGTGEGKVLQDDFDRERFEDILGAIVKIAEIKFPTITVGGGLVAFAGGVGAAFGFDVPQLTELTTFITNSKDAIISLANAASGTGDGNVITDEFNKENFESIIGAIANIASVTFPTVTEGGGFGAFIGPVSGFIQASGSKITEFEGLVDFIETAKDPIIRLANAVSGVAGEGEIGLTENFNKTAFESIVGAIAQLASVQYPTIENVEAVFAGLVGFAPFVGGLSTESKNDFDGFVKFITDVKQPIIDLATAVSGDTVTVDHDKINSICTAVKDLATAAKDIPVNSWVGRTFTGVTDFTSFTDFIAEVGPSIQTMNTSLANVEFGDGSKIEVAAQAVKTLAQASAEIPTEGGFWNWDGDTDWEGFKAALPAFGEGIAGFAKAIGGIQTINLDSVSSSFLTVTQAIAIINASLGGGLSDKMIEKYNETLTALADSITVFSDNVSNINIEATSTASKSILDLTGSIYNYMMGTDYSKIDVGTFKTKILEMATAMSEFSTKISGINSGVVSTGVTNIDGLISIINKVNAISITGSGWGHFHMALGKIATEMGTFATSLADCAPAAAIDNVTKVTSMLNDMSSVNYTGANSFPETLKKLAETSFNGFVNTFGGDEAKTAVTDAISGLTTAGSNAAKSSTAYENFYAAGKYCVEGFAAGIGDSDAVAKVIAAAEAAVRAAITAAEDEAGIASPAKEFIRIATYCGMGLTKGFSNYESKTYDSGRRLADSARAGLSDAISRVSDIIDSGIDAQPTIRPVLDLTDVSAGANRINSLFGTPSVGVMSRVGAISSMMNGIQNGSNNDVIAAINDLGSRIGDRPGDTYNINGITYDDGSNITSAVEALIRAAIRERRA